MSVKIGTDFGGGLIGAYQGVEYAIAAGADIISMSWGGGSYSATYQLIFDHAYQKGIICIAAAGNSNTLVPMYPAAYNHVISVGSTTSSDTKSGFSNYGSTIDVMAPGSNIYSLLPNGGYGSKSGTSMACPLVSGLAGLMLSYSPGLTPDALESCLKSTCDNIDAQNLQYVGQIGAGRINAFKALQCLATSPTANFEADFTTVCPGSNVQFTDKSFGANISSWEWTFVGGTPSSSSVQNPTVSYAATGTYPVKLKVTNSYGQDSITNTGYITVEYPVASITTIG